MGRILGILFLLAAFWLFRTYGFWNVAWIAIGLGLLALANGGKSDFDRPAIFQGRVGKLIRIVVSIIGAFLIYKGFTSPESDTQSVAAIGTATFIDSQETFGGYECTEDCSGHQAGYDWAEEHGIDDPDTCGGKSQSFIEGCMAFASQQ